jgi:hypothetical protein
MKILLSSIVLFVSVYSSAQQEGATLKAPIKKSKNLKQGWNPKLQINSNLSFQSSKDVTGQADGDTVGAGLKLITGSDHLKDNKEWRNTLKLDVSTNKTPTLPKYVKASDSFKFESIYLYGIEKNPKLGPYISGSVETQIFKSENLQSKDVTYITPSGSETASHYHLSDAFKPLTTKQAIGVFYKAISKDEKKLEFRFGIGAMQVVADDQFYVSKTTDTSVTIEALESYNQVGFEYGFVWKGDLNDSTSYSVSGDFLTPLNVDIDAGKECESCSSLELTNIEFVANIKTKINDWASLIYEYKAVKKPELLNKFQIQNGLVFNVSYDHYK